MCAQLAKRKQCFMRLGSSEGKSAAEGGSSATDAGITLPWKVHVRVLRFLMAGGPKLWGAVVDAAAVEDAADGAAWRER
jgi:hypothetical protein